MSEARATRVGSALRWAGLVLVLLTVFLRVLVEFDPLPYWSLDPMVMDVPMTGLGPAGALFLDVGSLAGLSLVLLGTALLRERIEWISLALLAVGLIAVAYHAGLFGMRDLNNTRLGFQWAAALASAVAALHASRDERLRRLTLASLVGVSIMLAARGALQVFVEHPETVASFEQTKDAFFASKGWDPDSAMARSYERRLNQPEATGWFGLANVYATIVSACAVALLGWGVCAIERARAKDDQVTSGWVGLIVLGSLAACWGLYLSGSRAGFLALAAGLGALVLLVLLLRCKPEWTDASPDRFGGFLAIFAALAVVVVIAIQPVLGDSAFDLSLRFRGFYMWGAARIALENAVAGVGPAGFQDAYMLAKPALAPENVASPHSVGFDLIATLGLSGVAWIALWVILIYRAGSKLLQRHPAPEQSAVWRERRLDFVALLAIVAVPTLIGAWVEGEATTPDRVIARLLGLAGWLGLSAASVALMRRCDRWMGCVAAGAIALAVHAQLDVSPVTFGANAWILTLLGAVAAGGVRTSSRARLGPLAGIAVALTSAFVAIWAWWPTARFDSRLADAASSVRPLVQIQARMDALGTRQSSMMGDSGDRIAADLGALVGLPPPQTVEAFGAALDRLFDLGTANAASHLESALVIYPGNIEIAASRAKLALVRADVNSRGGTNPQAEVDAGMGVLQAVTSRRSSSASAWSSLGSSSWRAARIDTQRAPDHQSRAISAWELAAALDPHGVTFPVRLHDAYLELGDTTSARDWANRALEADKALILDPFVGLTESERFRLEQSAGVP